MKLATMKIVCLLVLLGGVYMLGLVLDVEYMQQAQGYVLENWPVQEDGALNLRMPGIIAGVLLVLVGLYGFLPKMPSRKGGAITFKGANGDIVLQLKPIQKVLLKMMRRMPEVYSIKLQVRPDKDGKRALIAADVVLKNCAALGARHCAKIVAECISSTARNMLGLAELSAVQVNVSGIHLDAAATGKQVRDQLALRQSEESAAGAEAQPAPVAADATSEAPATNQPKEQPQEATVSEEATVTAETPTPQQECESVDETVEEAEEEDDQVDDLPSAAAEPEVQADEAPVAPGYNYEEPDAEMSETLHGIDLPPLADDDADLPPAPKINEEGEITTDEAADADIAVAAAYDDERTPDYVEVNVLQAAPWKHEDLPEPVPDELNDDQEDLEAEPEKYPNA
jgi:hypothetical protein